MKLNTLKSLSFLLLIALFTMCNEEKPIQEEPEEEYIPPVYEGVEYKLAERTKIITQEEFNNIKIHNAEEKEIIYKKGTNVKIPKVGTQIIIDKVNNLFPYGLLAIITNVEQDGESTKVTYEDITLYDAFEELYIDVSDIKLNTASAKVFDNNNKEIKTKVKSVITGNSIKLDIPQVAAYKDKTTIKTKFSSTITWSNFKIKIEDYSLKELNLDIKNINDIKFDMEAEISKQGNIIEQPIATIKLTPPIVIGMLVINPSFDINLVVESEGNFSITSGVQYRQSSAIKLNYDGKKWAVENKSVPVENENKSPLTFRNSKLLMNGKFWGGMQLSTNIGIYYKSLYTSFTAKTGVQADASINLSQSQGENDNNLYRTTKDSKLSTDFILGLDVIVGTWLRDDFFAKISIPQTTFPIWEGFFFPHFEKIKTSALTKNGATLEIKITNNLTLEADVKAKIYEVDQNENININTPITIVDFGKHKTLGNITEKIYKKAVTELKPNTKYRVVPYFEFPDIESNMLLNEYATDFKTSTD